MYSVRLRRSQSFHRIGIGAAAIVMLAGVALIAAAVFRLNLLETAHGSELAIALGGALVAFGILSIAAYGVVRAIEWASPPY
jgi:hypothetical protein